MKIKYTKRFRKQFKRLRKGEKDRFWERLDVLLEDENASILNRHTLRGKYSGLSSINIGGDLRALFVIKDSQLIIFEMIGTHSQLYG